MIAFLDIDERLDAYEAELGMPCEQFCTPRDGSPRGRLIRPGARFAVDNGAFSGLDVAAFRRLLAKLQPERERCRFVVVPDVVCSARRTLEVWPHWRRELNGWPLALAAQNGIEHLPIPWHELSAVFIGGDDAWKMGPHAEHVIRAAQALGKWVHVGRVNEPARLAHFERLGIDSFDGTGLVRTTRQRVAIRERKSPAPLFASAS